MDFSNLLNLFTTWGSLPRLRRTQTLIRNRARERLLIQIVVIIKRRCGDETLLILNTGNKISQLERHGKLFSIRGFHFVSVGLRCLDVRIIEHELVLILLQEVGGSLLVQEQGVDLLDVLNRYFCSFPLLGREPRHRDELYGVPGLGSIYFRLALESSPQTGLIRDLGQDCQCLIWDLRVLLLSSDLEYLLQFLLLVLVKGGVESVGGSWGYLGGGDDDGPVQEVEGQTVGTGVLSAADLGNACQVEFSI